MEVVDVGALADALERRGQVVDDVRAHGEHEILEHGRALAVDRVEHTCPGRPGLGCVERLEVEAGERLGELDIQAASR